MKKLLLPSLIAFCSHQCLSQCAIVQSATVNPLPVNNTYSPGTTVTFCYTIDSFAQTGTNWFHGVVLKFGPGWDTSTFDVVSLPGGCDANGVWEFFQSCTSTGSGQTFGPGFYFDSNQSSTTVSIDGIAGNNYGDDGTTCENESWTFCFSIEVDPGCEGGSDLSATATATGDGTTGSWSNTSCSGIPFNMISGVTCGGCNLSVTAIGTNPLCAGESGTATAVVTSGTPPYSYSWSPGGQTSATISDLTDGTYTVEVTDSTSCIASATVTIVVPSQLNADAGTDTTLCPGVTYSIGGNPTASGGTPPYHYSWAELSSLDDSNPEIITSISTTYHVTVTDTNGCVTIDSVLVTIELCLGIDDVNSIYSFDVFPNPNNGNFSVKLSEEILNDGSELILFDLFGEEVIRTKIVSREQIINLPNLAAGVYQVEIKSDHILLMKKILCLN